MIVTSAAGSPRSRASATAANTSRFIWSGLYAARLKPSRMVRLKADTTHSRASEPMQLTRLRRFRPRDERLVESLRAGRRRELAGLGVDVDERDALGRLERRVGVAGERRLHELRPDRQRRLRAAEADRLVVVEADPDHGEQLRREADEPGVAEIVGRAGLAGRVEREAGAARAGGGPFVEYAAHHVGHEERRVRPRDDASFGWR